MKKPKPRKSQTKKQRRTPTLAKFWDGRQISLLIDMQLRTLDSQDAQQRSAALAAGGGGGVGVR